MPFAYYGAKHGLAAKYPRPRHPLVIEPFAGSAAYSVHHAATIEHAILIDADERVVNLWHELQQMSVADVDALGGQLNGLTCRSPLVAGASGGWQIDQTLDGKETKVMGRMVDSWPSIRNRIVAALPHIRTWDVIHGTYSDAPDIDATWFVDPPYMEHASQAGSRYAHGQADIDFGHLAEWCLARSGLTIVCEQSPAAWLPFHPFATQANARGVARTEVIWRSDLEQPSLFAS